MGDYHLLWLELVSVFSPLASRSDVEAARGGRVSIKLIETVTEIIRQQEGRERHGRETGQEKDRGREGLIEGRIKGMKGAPGKNT